MGGPPAMVALLSFHSLFNLLRVAHRNLLSYCFRLPIIALLRLQTGKERHRRSGRSLGFGTRCLNELEGSMLLAFPNLADILQDFVRSG
jgi:hypothetical protein